MDSHDKVTEIANGIKELRAWTVRHEDRHGDDADMLALVLKDLDTHTNNHHGRVSQIKQGGWITASVALLVVLAEVLRQVFL